LPPDELGESRSGGKTALLLGAVLLIGILGFFGIRNMGATLSGKEKVDDTGLIAQAQTTLKKDLQVIA
jgi:hypothetical protein